MKSHGYFSKTKLIFFTSIKTFQLFHANYLKHKGDSFIMKKIIKTLLILLVLSVNTITSSTAAMQNHSEENQEIDYSDIIPESNTWN